MRLVACLVGLQVWHLACELTFPLSLGVALALGVFLPSPGSMYSRYSTWRYRYFISKLGPVAFVGASAVLLFAWAMWALLARLGRLSPEVTQ